MLPKPAEVSIYAANGVKWDFFLCVLGAFLCAPCGSIRTILTARDAKFSKDKATLIFGYAPPTLENGATLENKDSPRHQLSEHITAFSKIVNRHAIMP